VRRTRLLYPVLYVANIAAERSRVWSVGLSTTIGLFVPPFFRRGSDEGYAPSP
jgi:uncharacterized MAPEG superfamily protein